MKPKENLKVVEFIRYCRTSNVVYNESEVAGFEPKLADAMVQQGFAKLWNGDGVPVPELGGEAVPEEPGSGFMSPRSVLERIKKFRASGAQS